MEIYKWLESHWMQIGMGWFALQNFLKALQDTLGAMPLGLSFLAKTVYLMQGVGAYLFMGQRPQIGGLNVSKDIIITGSSNSATVIK